MLKLTNIVKTYDAGSNQVSALKGVSIDFRPAEFVAILGPSGCGKTTLLNIIGGLDRYTTGDLNIRGKSTKEFTDRDWDTYRNHSVGFVFQSYNLIPHQNILANVELALTLSGVKKADRRRKAAEALRKVGLEEHMHKKPNQLSGGQMQRVAIARALVNDPEILLADEPTGALDTETSVQVMDLLKEISHDRLVVMVTHNPELAEEYATRTVRLLDGNIIDDSAPYEAPINPPQTGKTKKTSMPFRTALSLSFKNLLTKKGRTILTAFAGSIGIIGIALILAISTGVNNYIDTVQQETLSSFPIQIEKESTNMNALLTSMMGSTATDGESVANRDAVYGNPVMYKMMKSMLNAEVTTNNLVKFKEYLDAHKDELNKYSAALQYGYDIKLNIYATDPTGAYAKADFVDLMSSVMAGGSMMSGISSIMENADGMTVWQELLTDPQTGSVSSLVSDQYDLIHGKWPTEKNELLLVLNSHNEISDITLYSLGLVDKQTMINSTIAAMMGKEDNGWDEYEGKSWTYEEICNIDLKFILPTDYYQYDKSEGLWKDISTNKALLEAVINKGLNMNIVGIVKPNEDATAAFLNGSLCYTNALTKYYIEALSDHEMVKQQQSNTDFNIISGLPFFIEENETLTEAQKIQAFRDYVATLNDNDKAALYEQILAAPSDEMIQGAIDGLLAQYSDKKAAEIIDDIVKQYAGELGYGEDLIRDMLGGYSKEELIEILKETVTDMIVAKYQEDAAKKMEAIKAKPSAAELENLRNMVLAEMYKSIAEMPEPQQEMMKHQINIGFVAQNWAAKTGMSMQAATTVIMQMGAEEFAAAFDAALNETAAQMYTQLGGFGSGSEAIAKVAAAFDAYLEGLSDEELLRCYENHMPDNVSDKSHREVLDMLGVKDEADPDFIFIYPIDFEKKENIASMIADYNSNASEDDQIKYTDIAAMLMSSVSSIITAISVVLICFVSISLVVSSIMIGIITYISVLERTKEIGILRAIGASKKDISRIFNAETMIIGFMAGLVGIIITVALCFPISWIARSLTGISSLTAVLPWFGYLLIPLSIGLTMIAGLFPSSMAAKKDPVVALRTE